MQVPHLKVLALGWGRRQDPLCVVEGVKPKISIVGVVLCPHLSVIVKLDHIIGQPVQELQSMSRKPVTKLHVF
uniref:Uncharacterized protein n=1 Tax=Anguilla anguilla TaxID=7936 RepID=A0A0E9XXL8_ANGAN